MIDCRRSLSEANPECLRNNKLSHFCPANK
jgi:hypothetical protein